MTLRDDSGASGNTGASASLTCTFPLTTNAGSNRLLVVGTSHRSTTTGKVVTGVTYNGVALTQLATQGDTLYIHADLWYLLNPAVGSYNVIVTVNEVAPIAAGGVVFQGADLTAPFGVVSKVGGTSSLLTSIALDPATTKTSDIVIDVLGKRNLSYLPTADVSQSMWTVDNSTNTTAAAVVGMSTKHMTGATTHMSWTWTTNTLGYGALLAVAVKAAAGRQFQAVWIG